MAMIRPATSAMMKPRLIREFQRPIDPELLLIGWRDHRDVRVASGDPARIGEREHDGEAEGEAPDARPKRNRGESQHPEKRRVGEAQRGKSAKVRIRFRCRVERLRGIGPDRCRDGPAEEVPAVEPRRRQAENEKADPDGEPVFADPRPFVSRLRAHPRRLPANYFKHGVSSLAVMNLGFRTLARSRRAFAASFLQAARAIPVSRAAANPRSRSAMMSSMCSSPTDRRT